MTLFLSSFVLALAFCAPPGVVTAETVRRGTAHGFRPALLVQLGSLVGDTTWALIALTGLAFLVENYIARVLLSLTGLALLLKLAWNAFRDARQSRELEIHSVSSGRGDFANGAFLSLGNPLNIVFWTGLGSTVFGSLSARPQSVDFALFFAGFLSGAVLWCFLMAGLIAWARRLLTPAFFRWVHFTCGVALSFFALQLGWRLVSLL